MARDWLRLVLAAAIASAFALDVPVRPVAAQTAKATKKAAKKAEPADDAQAAQGEATPKKKKQDPAEAQKAIEAAQKQLEAGRAAEAAQALSVVIGGGNLPPGLMSRALLYRGMAHRQTQKPALAISDLTSALWIKGGLGEADRAEALKQRAAAYADAGLGDQSQTLAAAPRTGGQQVATQSDNGGSGSGFGNFFGSLFGSSATSSQTQPAQAPAQKTAAIQPFQTSATPAVQTSLPAQTSTASTPQRTPGGAGAGWSTATEANAPLATQGQQTQAPAAVEGKFRVQLALVRSEAEANAIAGRVGSDLAPVFGPRQAAIDQTVVGNMGTFYRVRVGPYASAAEGQAACGRVKSSGLDCLVVTQ